MTLWEIRLAEQPPLVVEIEDSRNLATELSSLVQHLQSAERRPFWKKWVTSGPDPYWQITDKHRYHISVIAGVKPVTRPKREKRPVVGFKLPDAGK